MKSMKLKSVTPRQKFARAVSFGLRAVGMKRTAWNILVRNGIAYGGAAPALAALLSGMARGGFVVEHGCGIGAFPKEMKPGSFREYVGYDIGDESVRIANERAMPGSRFIRASMEEWRGEAAPIDLIICKEVIYYLSDDALRAFIGRAVAALGAGGRLVMTIHDKAKHARAFDTCRECGAAELQATAPAILIIVKQ